MTGRAVIVHDRGQAMAAVAAAAAAGVPVTLRSPPGAAAWLGAAVFARMVDDARRAHRAVAVVAVLDCGDSPGFALNALRVGIDAVRVAVPPVVAAKLADIAARDGCRLDTDPAPALDLAGIAEPEAACRCWFAATPDDGR